MLAFKQHFAKRLCLVFGFAVFFCQNAHSNNLGAYTFEVTPTVGINLPHDLWGVEDTLNVYGIQGAFAIADMGALTSSFLYQRKTNDLALTLDAGYRHEITSPLFNAYFDIGLHYSKFDLGIDRDSEGNCIPSNCRTDSGSYFGFYGGGGLVIPISSMTLVRSGFRFYSEPQAWVLISAGLGLRF